MSHLDLDLDTLIEEMAALYSADGLHWMELLLHTHIGGPVTSLFTQVEIIQRALVRKPEMVPDEVASLKENVRLASDNIRTVVKALAGAMRELEQQKNDAANGSGNE